MNFHSLQTVPAKTVDVLFHRQFGVNGPKSDEVVGIERTRKLVGFVDGCTVIRDGKADRSVDTRCCHRSLETVRRAVSAAFEIRYRTGQSAFGDGVRPHVGVGVDDHCSTFQSRLTSPPSMTATEPVTKSDSGEARYATSGPNSAGSPIRPAGIFLSRRARMSGDSVTALWASVVNAPGAMALTWIPLFAHSPASALVNCTSAPLTTSTPPTSACP